MRRVRHEQAMAKLPPTEIKIYEGEPCGFIPLSDGTCAIVDASDVPLVDQDIWHVTLGYAARNSSWHYPGRPRRMHRVIMGDPAGLDVDHVNGNRLDNRRSNLRLVTHTENGWNQHKITRRNRSGKTGVSWHKTLNKWLSRITVRGEKIHLGVYAELQDAIEARRVAELAYYREYAPKEAIRTPRK
jgi:HNH endonuclease